MTYKYYLDKSSKKFLCPACNKKTFVKYLDAETSQYLEAHIGRCDRESKCGYHRSPKGNKTLVALPQNFEIKKPTYHDLDDVGIHKKDYTNNNFIKYLQKYFCNVDIIIAINKYFIGTSNKWNGSIVFWQIDQNMQIHAGKIMLYNKNTGNRVKKPFNHVSWIHKVFRIENFVLEQCLFGLHNLNECEIKTIGIVESEKTAIIMSIFRPDMLWMATGAKTNFKASLLQPLKGRRIIAFPDKKAFEDWNKKAVKFRESGFRIECNSLLEHVDLEDGDDLIDFIIET